MAKTKTGEKKKSTVRKAAKPAGDAAAKTLRIPITNIFDGNDYSAEVLIGSKKTPANLILDTGSSTLAVVPSVYNASQDAGMQPTSLAQQVLYGT
jgi:hypothetical protein